jgi:hypothetical protein
MKEDKSELDKLGDAVDQVLAPEQAMKWGVRVLVAIITLGALFGVGRVVWHMVGKVDKAVDEVEAEDRRNEEAAEAATLTHDWFVLKKDAIDAATIEVRTRIDALVGHHKVAANRGMLTFKGKEDRTEAVRLRGLIADAQRRRLGLIRDYNQKATMVDASVLGDLPKHIEVAEVPAAAAQTEAE